MVANPAVPEDKKSHISGGETVTHKLKSNPAVLKI
jgi:hypothetical protein